SGSSTTSCPGPGEGRPHGTTATGPAWPTTRRKPPAGPRESSRTSRGPGAPSNGPPGTGKRPDGAASTTTPSAPPLASATAVHQTPHRRRPHLGPSPGPRRRRDRLLETAPSTPRGSVSRSSGPSTGSTPPFSCATAIRPGPAVVTAGAGSTLIHASTTTPAAT